MTNLIRFVPDDKTLFAMNRAAQRKLLLDSLDTKLSNLEPHYSILRNAIQKHFRIRGLYMSGGTHLSDFKMYDFHGDDLPLKIKRKFKNRGRRAYRRVLGKIAKITGVSISWNDNGVLRILHDMKINTEFLSE